MRPNGAGLCQVPRRLHVLFDMLVAVRTLDIVARVLTTLDEQGVDLDGLVEFVLFY